MFSDLYASGARSVGKQLFAAAGWAPPMIFRMCLSAYADVSEKIVSRKPLGSLTSNARLFHSVS